MSKVCELTGKKAMVGNNVSFSLNRTKRKFNANLMKKRFYLPEEDKWITLKVSTSALKTINKIGITAAIKEAKEKLEKVRQSILDGEITFAEAAREASDEEETKFDGGQLRNPETQDYNFELTKMDPELYSQIQNLKDNEVSPVLKDQDRIHPVKFKILTVTARVDEHEANFAQDYLKIKALALQEKQLNAIEKWQEEKIMDTYIKINGELRSCDFNSNWFKIN